MTTKVSQLLASSVLASLMMLGASATLADEPEHTAKAAPSKETREKMAAVHEKLAACLRSNKPIADCHSEAMKAHHELVGEDGCHMMDSDSHEEHGATHKQSGKPQ